MFNKNERLQIRGDGVRVSGYGREGEQVFCDISNVGLLQLMFQIREVCTEEEWEAAVSVISNQMNRERNRG